MNRRIDLQTDGEEGWTEYGALRNPTGDNVGSRFSISQSYALGTFGEVGMKPVKDGARETNVVLKIV